MTERRFRSMYGLGGLTWPEFITMFILAGGGVVVLLVLLAANG